MAHRLGPITFREARPSHYPEDANKLRAIDCFRVGNIFKAFGWMGLKVPDAVPFNVDIPPYGDDLFKPAIQQVITLLKEHGL